MINTPPFILNHRIGQFAGELINADIDFVLPGLIPLGLNRHYRAHFAEVGPLGRARTSALDVTIRKANDEPFGELVYRNEAGLAIHFDRPTPGPGLWEHNAKNLHLALAGGRDRSLVLKDGPLFKSFAKYDDNIWRLIKIEDRNGNAIFLQRSDDGLLVRLEQKDGLSLEFANDAAGRRIAVTLIGYGGERKAVAGYDYDARGNMTEARLSFGASRSYRYDRRDNLVGWSSGKSEGSYSYDEKRRVILVRSNGAHDKDAYEYDADRRKTRFLPGGHGAEAIISTFDVDGYLIAEEGPFGTAARSYEQGYLVTATDALGHTTSYTYDRFGNVRFEVDAEGRRTTYVWNEDGSLTQFIDNDGNGWQWNHDEKGSLEQIIRPDDYGTEIVNDEAGLPTKLMRSDGMMERRSYDAHHNLAAVSDFRGEVTRLERDEFGRIVRLVDPTGAVSELAYDEGEGNDFWSPVATVRPDGVRVHRRSDPVSGTVTAIDGEGRQSIYRFGPLGRLDSVTDAAGGTLHFAYDHAERLTRITNQLQRLWTFERDAAGRVVREEDFDGLVIDYGYDVTNRLIETRYANGALLTYGYDKSGLLLSEEAFAPPGPAVRSDQGDPEEVTRYWYDGRGLLERAENNAALVAYEYDAVGRIVAETVNGRRVESAYDCCGNRTQRTIGGRLVAAGHDPLGALQSLIIGEHAPLLFKRDALGRELSRHSEAGFVQAQNYDVVGQLVGQRAGNRGDAAGSRSLDAIPAETGIAGVSPQRQMDASAIVERTYGWDRAFAPITIKDKAWGELGYDYDANGQILQTRFGDGNGERFRYDAALNTAGFGEGAAPSVETLGLTPSLSGSGYLGAQAEKGIQGWLLSDGGRVRLATGPQGESIQLEHDVRGRVVRRKVERKGFRPKVWRYEWDAKDRLVRCVTPDGEAWRYGYDPFGRRVWKVRELTAAEARLYANRFLELIDIKVATPDYASMLRPLPSEQRKPVMGADGPDDLDRLPIVGIAYGWDGNVIAEEAPLRLDGGIDWDQATRWHYEPKSFRPLAKETSDGKLYYIVVDHLGTPREMFEENGKLAWAAEYRTWGEVRRLWLADAGNDNSVDGGSRAMYARGGGTRDYAAANGVAASINGDGEGDSIGSPLVAARSGGLTYYGSLALKDDPIVHEARFLCPIRFQGQWEDEESGLYYNRFRYYDPLAGQYVSNDPIGILGGLRSQGYVGQPTGWIDVLGLASGPRATPGVACCSCDLPVITDQWLRGTEANAGRFPGQIAEALNGRSFNSFDEFREAVWQAVAADASLSAQFSPQNVARMKQGYAPFALSAQQVGGRTTYELDHIKPISEGGAVYDMNNIMIRSPLSHIDRHKCK